MDAKPGDSSYQRELEGFMLHEIQSRHNDWSRVEWLEAAKELDLSPVWQNAQPDGVWKDAGGLYIVAECFVHLGLLKAGQRRKLASDVFKLQSIRNACKNPDRLQLCLVIPDEIEKEIGKTGWLSDAIHSTVEILTVTLTDLHRQKLLETINRQSSAQARVSNRVKEITHE